MLNKAILTCLVNKNKTEIIKININIYSVCSVEKNQNIANLPGPGVKKGDGTVALSTTPQLFTRSRLFKR